MGGSFLFLLVSGSIATFVLVRLVFAAVSGAAAAAGAAAVRGGAGRRVSPAAAGY